MGALIENQALINEFMSFMPLHVQTKTTEPGNDAAPDELVQRVLENAKGEWLWSGEWQTQYAGMGNSLCMAPEYPSQSEADYALLGTIIRHATAQGVPDSMLADVAIKVFEQSGLYREEKRGAIVNHAIPKLIASVQRGDAVKQSTTESKLPRLASQDGLIDFTDWPPPPRVYVLNNLILMSKVCVLAGMGGVSKTIWMMMLAVHTALGLPFMGKTTLPGAVLLILGEEDTSEISRRFNAIAKVMKLTPEQIQLVRQRARAYPMNGLDARLTRMLAGSLEGTEFTAEIIAATKTLESDAGVPIRLIGLDHAGLIHGGEFNTREDVVQTMRQVNYISQETGAATLVLAHSPKGAIAKEKADSADVAGSAAWVDLARAVFVIRTMSDDDGRAFGIAPEMRHQYASMAVVKNNYGPTGEVIWMRRSVVDGYDVSVLDHVNLVKPAPTTKGGSAVQARILDFVKTHPGQYSKTGLRDVHSGKDGKLKASKAEVAAALDALLADGQIKLRKPTEDERNKFGLTAQVTQVMEATK